MSGCCDQGIPDYEHRISDFTVYSGMNAGSRDAEVSIAWLRAYGATAAAVDGPRSTDPYKPFRNPRKFEGVLPVLWRDGDDVIYDLPTRSRSLAHVIPKMASISHAPENGLLTAELERYNAAVEDPAMPPASFRWTSRHSAHVSTSMQRGQLLNLQVSYDAGWNAKVAGGTEADSAGQDRTDERGDWLHRAVRDRTFVRWRHGSWRDGGTADDRDHCGVRFALLLTASGGEKRCKDEPGKEKHVRAGLWSYAVS